jgi:hypothetical protein
MASKLLSFKQRADALTKLASKEIFAVRGNLELLSASSLSKETGKKFLDKAFYL